MDSKECGSGKKKKTRTATQYDRLMLLETSAVGIQAYPDAHYNLEVAQIAKRISAEAENLNKTKEGNPMDQPTNDNLQKGVEGQAELTKAVAELAKGQAAVLEAVKGLAEKQDTIQKEMDTMKSAQVAEIEKRILTEVQKNMDNKNPDNAGLASKSQNSMEELEKQFQAEIDSIDKDMSITVADKFNKKVELVGSEVGLFLRDLALASRK